jgi:hypothetical protein
MSQTIVQDLEVVEVNKQHRDLAAVALRTGYGVLKAIRKQGPVGQASQGIVQRLVLELLLQCLAFGNVEQ